jgi:hypothetical protein
MDSMKTTVLALTLLGLLAPGEDPADLFNGKDLSGWVPVNGGEFKVVDGLLTVTGQGGNGWLRSEKTWKDFELTLEWKTQAEKYDSGVFFRALPRGTPWPRSGYQVQIARGDEGRGVGLEEAKPLPDAIKVKDWNAFELKAQGAVVSLKVNGKEAWTAEDKFPQEGHIGFQAEGHLIQFRNIRIKPLKSE